jgi:oxaloacetate decarboxylase alpha subunit
MARIEFIDQSLRDGQQSLWGMRMRAGHILPVAEKIDRAGYRVVDLTGSSIFEVLVRFRQEDPWRGLDAIHAAFPLTTLRAGTRDNGVVGMGITPDSIIELWVRTLAKHGIGSLWIFDCLHNVDKMLQVAKIARDAGVAPSPQVNFSESPVHTDEHYASIMDRMAAGASPTRSSSVTRPASSARSARGAGSGSCRSTPTACRWRCTSTTRRRWPRSTTASGWRRGSRSSTPR